MKRNNSEAIEKPQPHLQNGVILSGVLCVVSLQETPTCCVAGSSKLRQVQVSKAQLHGVTLEELM